MIGQQQENTKAEEPQWRVGKYYASTLDVEN